MNANTNRYTPDENGLDTPELLEAKTFISIINQNIKDYLNVAGLNSGECIDFKRLLINEVTPVFDEVAIDAILQEEFNMPNEEHFARSRGNWNG